MTKSELRIRLHRPIVHRIFYWSNIVKNDGNVLLPDQFIYNFKFSKSVDIRRHKHYFS